MLVNLLISALLVVSGSAASVPRAALTAYAPRAATCPTTPLVRPASGLSTSESGFISSRQPKSSAGLQQWLLKTNAAFGTSSLPAVALTTSGGGYRSLLSGAGVIQGLDSRDSSVGTSGVFQGLTYQAGLSGGAWLLSSFAGNNYPTVSSLKTGLWTQAFEDSLLLPSFLLSAAAYAAVTDDILAKQAAGFPPTLTDPYGRLLSYQLLYGTDGGVTDTLSGLTGESNFTSFNVPYPIIVSNGVETYQGTCLPPANATIYELAPYEFGSWDSGVSAFTQTKYLGSSLSNGLPTKTNNCTVNYDNLGYVLGTSSNLFNELCAAVPSPTASTSNLDDDLALIVDAAHALTTRDEYAVYPNPFYNYAQSSLVASQQALFLVDGGEAGQNNPIWPLIQPSRTVNVIIVNDNSADTTDNFPNGTEIYQTYLRASQVGLTKMPVIPPVATFVSQGLNKRPTFFGCNDATKVTIVYLPNVNYTFPSNEPTSKLQYSPSETSGMIANGVEIATKNGDPQWPTCLGCGIMKKTGGALPAACAGCFTQYCYN
ncbi:hypothetical protein MMC20_000670 [Loxospora ochrophaea]|nr:hypothetical protein [Loxospora ochrophaea]